MVTNPVNRVRRVHARVRYGHKRLKRLSRTATLSGIFLSFLQLGLTGFGGGLAVIAQIRRLTIQKRHWFTEHDFAEASALGQSLPGTAAGNIVTYVGLRLRGIKGAAVALAGFILPSVLMMIVLAILYRHLRALPNTERFFHGLNAAIVALVVATSWRMGRLTLNRPWQWYVAVLSCLAVIVLEATILEVMLVAGLVGIYIDSFAERRWLRWRKIRKIAVRRRRRMVELRRKSFVGGYITRAMAEDRVRRRDGTEGNDGVDSYDDWLEEEESEDSGFFRRAILPLAVAMPLAVKLGLLLTLSSIFLRIGAVTFGGGFVMVPLIEAEVVNNHHWLTHQEFVEAFALGQITPGPVLVTATFIGYRVAGTLGALVATVSIFLPSFAMTVAAGSSLRRFRANRQVQAFLRGVTPAVVGVLVAAAWAIGRAGIHTWVGLVLSIVCLAIFLRTRVSPIWILLAAGVGRLLIGLAWR